MKNTTCKTKIIKWLLLSLGIVVAICVLVIISKRNYIPAWVNWQEETYEVLLKTGERTEDDDDCAIVTVKLADKHMEVSCDSTGEYFMTDKGIKVQDTLSTDLDGDGLPELVTVVWKKGLFGKHRPFWITSDEKNYSQHVFIYGIDKDGKVSQKWFASETGILINSMEIMEKNTQIISFEDTNGNCTLWRWEGFGLKFMGNLSKSKKTIKKI